eukprot:Skav203932  [mRNA]  locus=scaffold228:553444:554758:- [translate_table: standard]
MAKPPKPRCEASSLEGECFSSRSKLRGDLEGDLSADRSSLAREDRCDLSDEEDDLLENIGDGEEAFK